MDRDSADGGEYDLGDEVLEEIEVSNDLPMDEIDGDDDDASTVWTDATGVEMEQDDNDGDANNINVVDISICTFNGHTDSVYCSAYNVNNQLIISGGGDDKAYIWKYDQTSKDINSSILELTGHTDTVTSVGFNFDGSLALTGAYDGTIRVWDSITGELKLVLDGPEDIEWACWHQKGNVIIAGSRDGTIWMWLVQNGQCMQVFAGHDGGVSTGCFTSDGKLICSGGDDGSIRIWGPKSGQCKTVFDGHLGHEATVTCIVSSNYDEDLLLTGSVDGTMKLLQISGKRVLQLFLHASQSPLGADGLPIPQPPKQVLEVEGGIEREEESVLSVECIGFSSKELHWVASGGLDHTLKVWDMTTGTCRCVCKHGGSVVSLKWHSMLPIISTAALDNVVRLWDARTGLQLSELTGHTDIVTNIEMYPLANNSDSTTDTDFIVSVSDDNTAKVFHFNANAFMSI